MNYYILCDHRTSTPFKEKSFNHFKDLRKMKLLANFDVNLTSFLGVMNYVWKVEFVPPPGNEVRLTSKLVISFSL